MENRRQDMQIVNCLPNKVRSVRRRVASSLVSSIESERRKARGSKLQLLICLRHTTINLDHARREAAYNDENEKLRK